MPQVLLACPKCGTELALEAGTDQAALVCNHCRSFLEATFFPAYFRAAPRSPAGAPLIDQSEASCFYHPQKEAAGICDGCGRLLCALCSVEMGDQHLCPTCIASGSKKGKIVSLETRRTRYDSLALGIAAVGIFFYFFSIFTAPAAIYLAIRHWNSPGSVLGVRKWKFVLAIVLSVVALIFWCGVIFALIFNKTRGGTR